MANPEFKYAPMFQLGEDKTEYRLISKEGVSVSEFEGTPILKVSKEALELLTTQAFHDVNFMLRREHNEKVAEILNSPEASDNDKYVALTMLRNAEVACKGQLLSAKTQAQLSSTARRDSRCGQASRMRSLWQKVSTTHTPRTTSATHRTHHSTCTTR